MVDYLPRGVVLKPMSADAPHVDEIVLVCKQARGLDCKIAKGLEEGCLLHLHLHLHGGAAIMLDLVGYTCRFTRSSATQQQEVGSGALMRLDVPWHITTLLTIIVEIKKGGVGKEYFDARRMRGSRPRQGGRSSDLDHELT